MARILFIADSSAETQLLDAELTRNGHEAVHAPSMAQGLREIGSEPLDLVIANLNHPDGTAHFIERLRRRRRSVPMILLGPAGGGPEPGPADPGITWLPRPLELDCLRQAVDRALQSCGLAAGAAVPDPNPDDEIVGRARALVHITELARVVAPTAASVLIEGESGTGKELLVRAIHRQSPRARAPIVAVNCAAMPEGLVESTLFGHERGAFTGATSRLIGAFERAHRGTLLLDEISELRLDLQAKLLRAIQEKQFERVGGSSSVRVDVRIVATTNRDLLAEVKAGRFRPDLYYRLAVVRLRIPPLRDRLEDVPLLVRHFTAGTSRELGIAPPEVPAETIAALQRWPWPGNVRELEHATQRAVILHARGPLLPADFLPDEWAEPSSAGAPVSAAAADPGGSEVIALDVLERQAIARALAMTGGHRARAARLLGISDRTLRHKLNGPPQRHTAERSGFPRDAAVSSGGGPAPGEELGGAPLPAPAPGPLRPTPSPSPTGA